MLRAIPAIRECDTDTHNNKPRDIQRYRRNRRLRAKVRLASGQDYSGTTESGSITAQVKPFLIYEGFNFSSNTASPLKTQGQSLNGRQPPLANQPGGHLTLESTGAKAVQPGGSSRSRLVKETYGYIWPGSSGSGSRTGMSGFSGGSGGSWIGNGCGSAGIRNLYA